MNVTEISDVLMGALQQMQQMTGTPTAPSYGLYATAAASILLPVVVAGYRKFFRGQGDEEGRLLASIHFYAGSLPNSDNTRLCIELLRKNPNLVNKTLPDQYCVSHGYTPFLRACWNNNVELIQFMICNGANIRVTNSDGESALYLVAYRVSKSTTWDPRGLNLLWNAGCSVDDVNVHSNSMLHLAAKTGHSTLARWLLLHGADPAVCNSAGLTARALALRKGSPGHLVVANLLRRPAVDRDVRCHFEHRGDGIKMAVERTASSPVEGTLKGSTP